MCEDYIPPPDVFHIGRKGVYVRPDEVVSIGSEYDPHWGSKLSPWERLFQHHTLNSAGQHSKLRRRRKVTGDALDFTLSSVYNHSTFFFPTDWEIYRQKESLVQKKEDGSEKTDAFTLHSCHGVVIGGIKERRSPHAVRLNLSSHHMSRTAGGYGRKVDGTFYAA